MEIVPEFWRTEIWHPISVHLPLAALLIATLFKIVEIFYTPKGFKIAGTIVLILGVIGVWFAIITGNWADGAVARNLCDPTVLKVHENYGFLTAYLFTIALVVDILNYFNLLFLRPLFISILLTVIMLFGSFYLFKTGHEGAKLVYQQGAGVYQPSESCAEFE